VESELPKYEPTLHDLKMGKLAQPFTYERELAFFVVQVGLSIAEYDMLTEKEKMFIRKEYENKFVKDMTWLRNAVLNATVNANRKRNQPFRDLFPKKAPKADKEYNEKVIQTVEEIEARNGKGWVELIYRQNGMKIPLQKGGK